jgi:HAD superfamily hydrolase (TIGR01509 family)
MITTQFKAVIFDMDGTLVNNMNFHQRAWIDFLKTYNVNITEEEFHEKNHGTITEVVPRFFSKKLSFEEIAALGQEKEQLYRNLYRPHLKPIDGLIDFLGKLKEANTRVGLATAGDIPNIDFTIDGLDIRHYFSAITGSEEVQRGKPDPEVYLLTASKMNIDPANCLVVEDTISGIKAGLAAGMQVMAVTTTVKREVLTQYKLYRIIDDYTGL